MLQRFISLFFMSFIVLSFKALAEESPVQNSYFKDDFLLYESNSSGSNISVDQGDTLWSIAFNLRLDLNVTMSQMMLAIFNENPNAFEGNVNILKKDSVLKIPFAAQVIQVNSEFAFDEVQRQHAKWNTITNNNYSMETSSPSELLESETVNENFGSTLTAKDQSEIQNKNLSEESEDFDRSKRSNHQSANILDKTNNYDLAIKDSAAKISPEIYPQKESKSDSLIKKEFHAGNSETNSKIIDNQDTDSQLKNRINNNEESSIDIFNTVPESIEEKTFKTNELVEISIIILFILIVLIGVSRLMRKDSSIGQSSVENNIPQKKISDKTKSQAKDLDLSSNETISIVGTKLDLARAYVDMGDPVKALNILEEVLDEGNELQRKEAKSLLKNISK